MQLVEWTLGRRKGIPSGDSSRHAESDDSTHESQAPLSERVSQVASGVGMAAGASYALFKGIRGEKAECAVGVTLVGFSAYTLWLVKRNSELRRVGSFTKKLDHLGDEMDSDTKKVTELNRQIDATGKKIADETSEIINSVHKAEQVTTELLRRESDLVQREARLVEIQEAANQKSEEENARLKKRLSEEETAHQKMKDMNANLQSQIDDLTRLLNEEKSGLASLRAIADERRKEIDELRKLMEELKQGTKALQRTPSPEPNLGHHVQELKRSVDEALELMRRLTPPIN